MSIEIDIFHKQGDFTIDTKFSSESRLTALFGPSGSGKTSLVNMISGLVTPERGKIAIGGKVLVDTDKKIFIPRHKRQIGYIFQESRLFPHMKVKQNLSYGRRCLKEKTYVHDFDQIVDMLGIGHLLERMPVDLSGGEKQRVAIGRAMLSEPKVLLMDEPLASLDEQRRIEIMPYIERLRDESGVPVIYVSHSVSEVARLASYMVMLSEGRVAATGTPYDVMQRFDLDAVSGRKKATTVLDTTIIDHDEKFALTYLSCTSGILRVPRLKQEKGTKIRVLLNAKDIMIGIRPPEDLSALNVLEGIVSEIGFSAGTSVDVRINCNNENIRAIITRYSMEKLGIAPGKKVYAIIKSIAFGRQHLGSYQ